MRRDKPTAVQKTVPNAPSGDIVTLGRFAAAFGVKGWLGVYCYSGEYELLCDSDEWLISADRCAWQYRRVEQTRFGEKNLLAKLAGCNDRDAALSLSRWHIGIPRHRLPKLDRDEYYWCDLIGMRVLDEQRHLVGTVESLISSGAHDLLQVRIGNDEKMLLIPFVGAYIDSVDLDAGEMVTSWLREWC